MWLCSGIRKRLRCAVALGSILMTCGASGCDGSGDASVNEPYTSPRPAHPAMVAPSDRVRGGEASGSSPHGSGLPHDHPPTGTSARASRPADGGASLQAALARVGLAAEVPEGWVEEPSSSSMRLATIRLPGDGEGDGEMSIIPAGGSVEANVSRWRGQFEGSPEAKLRSETSAGGIAVALVEIDGTFSPGSGPMMRSREAPRPDTLLLGAIVAPPGSDRLIFCKAWGPRSTMEGWREAFESFALSFTPATAR